MRLLILTQKIDKGDPVLGFFHGWVAEFSKRFGKVTVICLEKGAYDLPEGARVFSLGKESGRSKIKYVKNFINLILGLNREYDAVFVHMNQEYVILGGFFWKIMGKKVYLWRNHKRGGLLTRIAVWISDKVFCTSKFSYTAKFKKTEIMPVGIDTELFRDLKFATRNSNSILFLGRMDPIKRPDLLIEALGVLDKKSIDFSCNFYGDPTSGGEEYYLSLKNRTKDLKLEKKVNFCKGVPNTEAPKIYREHEIFVNLTPSGSFDKTILEAAACGCIVLASNASLKGQIGDEFIFEQADVEGLATRLLKLLSYAPHEKEKASTQLVEFAQKHSLKKLIEKLFNVINIQT